MPFFDIGLSGSDPQRTLTGIEMWHISGTGVDEMWGAKATDEPAPQAFPYETPYSIMNAGVATLHIAKLSDPVTCPTQPSLTGSSPYDGVGTDDPDRVVSTWSGPTLGWTATTPLLFQDTEAYSAELNIQGKYVYGYNWDLKSYDTGGVAKGGWWRLTFLGTNLDFTEATQVAVPIVPPAVPPTVPPETEGRLYVPVVRADVDLTFIDVCIASAKGGGGNSRKPPDPGEE
jgi:hypothetical protein